MSLFDALPPSKKSIFLNIKRHAENLLDHSPRFKFFTLHGKTHIESMLKIADILVSNGIDLEEDEGFLLLIAICLHDLGMIVPLLDIDEEEIFENRNEILDPSRIESYIRNDHHRLVDKYVEDHFDFLISLGLSPADCGLIKSISKCHRKVDLREQQGLVKKLGALIRIIDELDIGPERAPSAVLMNTYNEMDSFSCWHWFKHNIVDKWRFGHNVIKNSLNGNVEIIFQIIVRPPSSDSITYWINKIKKPILRVLVEEYASQIVREEWGVKVKIEESFERSSPNSLGSKWKDIEQKSFSGNRKIILLIDDEIRKLYDLLLPLMDEYTVKFSPNAKDAISILGATNVDLAIVDMQIGDGGIWGRDETDDYRSTGIKLCREIQKISPSTKIGILTGTRHDISRCKDLSLAFIERKPVDPERFERIINEILN